MKKDIESIFDSLTVLGFVFLPERFNKKTIIEKQEEDYNKDANASLYSKAK